METNDGSLDYTTGRLGGSVLQGAKYLDYDGRAELGMVSTIEELLIMDTEPKKLKKRHGILGKNGFFGIEAHTEVPIETIAIALASVQFASYEILVVDSFQLMNGTKPQELNAAIGETRQKMQLFAQIFNLGINFSLCSEFFKTKKYREIFHEIEAAVMKSDELTELVRKTVPDGKNKNNLSYAIHEIATTLYMHVFKGADVKVGQQREKLYDAVTQTVTNGLDRGVEFSYLLPFFALGTKAPEEVTPYKPYSGTKNGGKRILVNEFDNSNYESISRRLDSGPAQAQMSLYRMALAAGVASREPISGEAEGKIRRLKEPSNQFELVSLEEQLKDALFRFVIRPYETRKIDRAMGRYLQTR